LGPGAPSEDEQLSKVRARGEEALGLGGQCIAGERLRGGNVQLHVLHLERKEPINFGRFAFVSFVPELCSDAVLGGQWPPRDVQLHLPYFTCREQYTIS
jgi:hypothetical protein